MWILECEVECRGHKKHINRFPSGVMKGVREREVKVQREIHINWRREN